MHLYLHVCKLGVMPRVCHGVAGDAGVCCMLHAVPLTLVSCNRMSLGEKVTRIGEEGDFTRIRTSNGSEGLIRSTYLFESESWQPPAWLVSLERSSEKSAARRRRAEVAIS